MSRSTHSEHSGATDTDYVRAHLPQSQPAANRRRYGVAPAAWIFILHPSRRTHTCWYWARRGPGAGRSLCAFRSFDECVTDAREHGFDFEQPYHVTAIA